jgi:hypothetical protein
MKPYKIPFYNNSNKKLHASLNDVCMLWQEVGLYPIEFELIERESRNPVFDPFYTQGEKHYAPVDINWLRREYPKNIKDALFVGFSNKQWQSGEKRNSAKGWHNSGHMTGWFDGSRSRSKLIGDKKYTHDTHHIAHELCHYYCEAYGIPDTTHDNDYHPPKTMMTTLQEIKVAQDKREAINQKKIPILQAILNLWKNRQGTQN